MAEDLTLEEAKKLVAKFSNSEHKNEEHELFKAAAAKLLEEKDPGFEYEYEHEEESEDIKNDKKKFDIKQGLSSAKDATAESGNLLTSVKDYGFEIVQNIQSLGAAGSVAFTSATYFQSTEMIETTQEVVSIVEAVEHDYGQTLNSYMFEHAAIFVEKIPYVNEIKLAQNVAAKFTEISINAETPEERKERREAEKEAESEESTEEVETEESTENVETEESTENVESEQTEESNPEEAETKVEAESEQTEESTEEVESDNQQEIANENEIGEESKNEESSIEADSGETTPDLQTDPLQGKANDSGNLEDFDSIKPHSMVGNDAFESMFTPNDAIVASPAGSQND